MGSFSFHTMAKGNDKYNIELALNPKETNSFLWSNALKEGNKYFLNDDFKNSDKTDGSAKLKFSIDEIDETSVGAGNSSLLLNYRKDTSYPLDSTPVKALQIPILKGYLKKSYNLLATTWAAYQNATIGVTTTTIDSNVMNSWKAYAERKIRSTTGSGAIADLPSKTAGVTSSADLNGGTAAYFFFEEQTDGTNKMFIKAKAVYLCNIGISLAFFVTPKIETYYNHEF